MAFINFSQSNFGASSATFAVNESKGR